MFQRLQQKWKVNGWRLLLILVTFALGGSLCGYLGRQVLGLFDIKPAIIRIPLYIIVVTILWPFCVILVSIPLGQFTFFRNYLRKMGRRMRGKKTAAVGRKSGAGSRKSEAGSQTSASSIQHPEFGIQNIESRNQEPEKGSWPATPPLQTSVQNAHTVTQDSTIHQPLTQAEPNTKNQQTATVSVAIFASGAGSNAQKIIDYFRNNTTIKIALIVCNKPGAGVLNIAEKEHIPVLLIEKEVFFRGNGYQDELKAAGIDFIVLAGFLWKVPSTLTAAYPNRIVNIHPALLPRYGGKGMYGMHVHEAIIAAGEQESGITIHYVDNVYDNGDIIFQATCPIEPGDTPASLAQKVHQLEHAHYPRIIEQVIGHLQNQR